MNVYSLDDAIELLCACRDRLEKQQQQSADATSSSNGGSVLAVEDVVVKLQLVPSKGRRGTSSSSSLSRGTRGRQCAVQQLEQWWVEGIRGVAAVAPAVGWHGGQPPTTLQPLGAPGSPRAPAIQERHTAADTSYADEAHWQALHSSTYEVPSPILDRDARALNPPPQLQRPQYHPPDYSYSAPAAISVLPPSTPPQQPPRSVVVRSQPNMRKERAGQHGVSWVIH